MAAIVFFALNSMILPLWFPTTYEFSPKGIIRSRLKRRSRMAWSDIVRYERQSDGVLLSTDSQPWPLTGLRSWFVRWDGRRDELVALLDFYLAPDAANSQHSTQTHQRNG
jgi:hypothetical protein